MFGLRYLGMLSTRVFRFRDISGVWVGSVFVSWSGVLSHSRDRTEPSNLIIEGAAWRFQVRTLREVGYAELYVCGSLPALHIIIYAAPAS